MGTLRLLVSLNQLIQFCSRVYAISSGNRVLVIYFVTLLLARMAISLVLAFAVPPGFRDLQSIPIDAFNLCGIIRDLKCMAVPYLIGTVFGTSCPF